MKITYNPLYKKDGKTLVGALSSASTDDIIFDLPGSAIWAKRKKFLGTDSNVLLSLTTTSNWRPITLGYQNDSKGSANLYKTVTLQIYTTNILQYLPSTGTLQTTILTSTGNTVVGGDIKMTAGGSAIHWNAGTYQLRILTTDDSTANTAVFTFLQSEDSAKTWKNLFTIYDNKYVEASGFVKTGSSNLYVLLGGGSHKALSDFSTAHSHPYLPLAGGTMTGDINFYFHADNTKPNWKPGTFNGLKWTGSSDSAYLYARCASGNDLEVHLNFTDDNAELFKIDWNGKTRITFGYNGVYSVGFHHSSHDSNDSVLLAGGSYKALSDFAMSNSKLPNPYSISFKNTSNTTVSYNGSAALDLTGGIYYSVYSTIAARLEGGSIPGWGTLTSANGYTNISSYDYGNRGAYGWAGKGGLMSMQVDGWFYLNEGRYRVLDTSDKAGLFTDFSNKGSQTTSITIGGTTKTLKIDSDLLDGYHETTFYRYRGSYGKSRSATSTEYTLGPGTYITSESGYSGTLLSFNSTGSASCLLFWTHYSLGNLYYRTSVDSNRWGKTNGAWTRILDSDNYTSYLGYIGTTAVLASSANLAMTGILGINMAGSSYIIMPASTNNTNITTSTPTALTYGRLSGYGSFYINADSDRSTSEVLLMTSGRGFETNYNNGLSVWYDSVGVFGANRSYKFYVNGSSYFNGTIYSGSMGHYLGGWTQNGISHYQWDGAVYRNPGSYAPALVLRLDNNGSDINYFKPVLTLYNHYGVQNATVGIDFAIREANGNGNAVNVVTIMGIKESTGNANAWSAGGLQICTKNYGIRVDALRINYLGNVGIGTTSPSYKLDVRGDICMASSLYARTTNRVGAILTVSDEGNNYGHKVALGGGGTTIVGAGESAQDFRGLVTDENLYLTADGNVNIYTNCDNLSSRKHVAHFSKNGNTYIYGGLHIGSSTSNNYIAFYGNTGDAPGSYVTTFIGEHLWGGSESTELLLMKFNDGGNDVSGTTAYGAGPDRIRHVAHAHVFQIRTNTGQGDFATMASDGNVSTVLELAKHRTIVHNYANLTKVYNSSNHGDSSSVTFTNLAAANCSSVGMIYAATDNPTGGSSWCHAWSLAWSHGSSSSWVSQIALGTLNGSGMWYRCTSGNIAGRSWIRVIDTENMQKYLNRPYTTQRDFPSGTLIYTDISYPDYGDPFYLEIKGNSYGRNYSVYTTALGYIYYGTLINYGVAHLGYHAITGLKAMRLNGYLCFWFPRLSYWEGYSIIVNSAYNYSNNRVTNVVNSGDPGGDKRVDLGGTYKANLFMTSFERPGVTKLYRRDYNDAYNLQHHWTGSYWYLRGYYDDSYHAGVLVATSEYPLGFDYRLTSDWSGSAVPGKLATGWCVNGADIQFKYNGGALNVNIDGYFYQGCDYRGIYRVLDEYDRAHSTWSNSDTLDGYHASYFATSGHGHAPLLFYDSDVVENSGNLASSATAHRLSVYRNAILFPYQMDNSNDGGIIRCRGRSESTTIFEMATWDDYGLGETILFNYYPTSSTVTPTYSVSVPKKSGTIALVGDLSGYHNITSSPGNSGNGLISIGRSDTYQWILSHASSTLYINPLGNNVSICRDGSSVGIGTSSPSYKLDVRGETRILTYGIYPLYLDSNSSSENSIRFRLNSQSVEHVLGLYSDRFFLWNSSIGQHVTILNNGDVGIGSTSPSYKLDVNGDIWARGAMRIGSSSQNNYLAFYGVYGDSPGGWDHTFIGERIYNSGTEQSELLIAHGNDIGDGYGPYGSGSGCDRIRLFGGGIRFDIGNIGYSGWEGAAKSSATTILDLALYRSTLYKRLYIHLPSDQRHNGIVGTYDPYRLAAMWSMGDSYQIASNGTNFGNLYGFAYTHHDYVTGYGQIMGYGHLAVWAVAGNPMVGIGEHLWARNCVKIGTHSTNDTKLSIAENTFAIDFRPGSADGYTTGFTYGTYGQEYLALLTNYSTISLIFANGYNPRIARVGSFISNDGGYNYGTSSDVGMQIKQNCVNIGDVWRHGVSPDYKLKVTGKTGIYYSASDGNPAFKINLTSNNYWAYAMEIRNPNMSNDTRFAAFFAGKYYSTYNSLGIYYHHVADSSSSNHMGVHVHGWGDVLDWYPGSIYHHVTLYGYGIVHRNVWNSAYVFTTDGGVAHIGSMSVNYANSAGTLAVRDVRDAYRAPNYFDSFKVTAWFNQYGGPYNGDWCSAISVKGWHDGYHSWQIGSYSSTGTGNYDLFFRNSNGDYDWHGWRRIIDSSNIGSLSVNYANYSGWAYRVSGNTTCGQSYMYTQGTGTYDGAIQIREYGGVCADLSAWGYAPRLSFHWGNRYARSFGMRSDGQFAVDDNPIVLNSDSRLSDARAGNGSGSVEGAYNLWGIHGDECCVGATSGYSHLWINYRDRYAYGHNSGTQLTEYIFGDRKGSWTTTHLSTGYIYGYYCHYGRGMYHHDYGSSAYTFTTDGGVAHIGSMSVNYATSAGSASNASSRMFFINGNNADGASSNCPVLVMHWPNRCWSDIWYDGSFHFGSHNGYNNGATLYASAYYADSDIRYKSLITTLDTSIESIASLPIFKYTWNDDKHDTNIHIGSSAQAVMTILPELVTKELDRDFYNLDYATLGVVASITTAKELVLVNLLIQKQKSEVELLKERIYELEQRLAYFESHSVLNTDSIS